MFTLNFVFYLLVAVSLIGLGIIVYRKISVLARLSEGEMTILDRKRGVIQRIREIDYKQYWLNFMIALEKFLRRIKIVFLKIENLLSKCINFLRNRSQIMTQKSREWIRQREMKRRKIGGDLSEETKNKIPIKIDKTDKEEGTDSEIRKEGINDEDELSISELKRPIKEEQKWIDLIVEDPKNITAYKFLGLLYWRQHNYSDAKASLKMAVKFGSKDKKVKEVLKELKKMEIE
jgi:hypothetical protein